MAIPEWAMKGFEGEIKLLKEWTLRYERSHSCSHTGLILILEGEAERSATLEKQMQDSRIILYLDDPG
jgi:hypothetical protein